MAERAVHTFVEPAVSVKVIVEGDPPISGHGRVDELIVEQTAVTGNFSITVTSQERDEDERFVRIMVEPKAFAEFITHCRKMLPVTDG